ncbi:MAG: response regulator transcription factor [Pseudomonadota bacterium]
MLKVLIVEDDQVYAQALKHQLMNDDRFGRIATATCLSEARQFLEAFEADLVVLDLELPDGSGADLLRELNSGTRTLVLTIFGDEANVLSALAEGASGYLLKDDVDIPNAMYAVANGSVSMNPTVARYLLDDWRDGLPSTSKDSPLSVRETETLEWLARGYSYQDVAQKMTISTHTVSDHVKRIYRKLTVHSRAEAVHEALRLGYIVAPDRSAS